ncbi:MAG: hypothetical protein KGZ49_03775 [Syntrophaceae bacterium]|nr:hypothetical protein [Syntrophaceae bacterium]
MSFTESNTVEQMILDAVAKRGKTEPWIVHEDAPGWGESLGGELRPARWDYVPAAQLPRQIGDVMVELWVREALIRLNPEIAAQPDHADEVIYNLRACLLSVQADGLVRANENFMAWLRGEKTMPFGPHGEHVTVRLVDASHPANNRLTVCNQWTYQAGAVEKRFDVVFLVNGLPMVIGEAKTPTRSAVTWFDGAFQVNEIYEKQVPAMFVPNVFSFATEGRLFRYGSIRMAIDMWGPWRDEESQGEGQFHHVKASVTSMLRPDVVLDILQYFTLFATDKKHRRIKVICRYQQYFTTNQIVDRVVKGYPKKGLIGPEASAIVMTAAQGDPPEWRQHVRDKDAEEKLLDRFRDPADPLQFVIVTSKLLTGFDAPILQVMYLDKPMKDHNLLQAICRTNRTFGQEKTHGLIVDYIGIFDDVARALDFDEKAVQQVVSNIDELRKALPVQVQKCLAFFPGVDRSVGGYEGLMAAQQCLPNNEVRDTFAANYIVLGTIWEALSPDPCLSPYEKDYRWLTQVYESVKPPSGNGKLLWHSLGAKTVELINANVHVESVRDDVETLVMDAQVLEEILKDAEPDRRAREIEIQLIARLRKHLGNPKFTALGERLEKIKERHEQGFLTSLEFLKAILEVAKEVVEAERESDPEEERDRAKEALTELFNEAKGKNTHIIVERIVADIDGIVKKVRFPDWQHTSQGERLVQKELRRTLLKYKLHTTHQPGPL